jgi:hypothetical protein
MRCVKKERGSWPDAKLKSGSQAVYSDLGRQVYSSKSVLQQHAQRKVLFHGTLLKEHSQHEIPGSVQYTIHYAQQHIRHICYILHIL